MDDNNGNNNPQTQQSNSTHERGEEDGGGGDGTDNDESLDGVVAVSLMSDADASGEKMLSRMKAMVARWQRQRQQ